MSVLDISKNIKKEIVSYINEHLDIEGLTEDQEQELLEKIYSHVEYFIFEDGVKFAVLLFLDLLIISISKMSGLI
jgi:hypothetical protein